MTTMLRQPLQTSAMSELNSASETDEDVMQSSRTDEDISPVTVLKLLLFLVWWFSGIGVGTAFMAPEIIGTAVRAELFLVIVLAFFSSILLIVALLPGPDDSFNMEPP